MSTLLLRLAGPLQAWGTDSKFNIRRTGLEPSKSGVVGLLAAALGRRRDKPLDDLAALRMGVRTDQEGTLLRDFHMVRKDKKAFLLAKLRYTPGSVFPPETERDYEKISYTTERYYLSDAVFLVGLESEDDSFLQALDEALKCPAFPLFLGRRSCPPTLPLTLGIRECGLLAALQEEPWLAASWRQPKLDAKLRLISDGTAQDPDTWKQSDLPVSFHPEHRRYAGRLVVERGWADKQSPKQMNSHDVMAELKAEG